MNSYKKDANNQVVFSKDMKLIELIDADHHLLSVLIRLDIQLPFGDVSVEEICERYDLSTEAFLMICKVCSLSDYEPEIEGFDINYIKLLLSYLRSSHRYYLESLLPTIEHSVDKVLEGCLPRQSEILRKFYGDYAEEVRNHLAYEDMHIFPYVESLIKGELTTPSRMGDFMEEHTDICDKVDDIKSIIIKYLPEQCLTKDRSDLLYMLYDMRDDLTKHTLIELKILTPMVQALERRVCNG